VALVAPASGFARDEFDAGIRELTAIGFEPVYDERVFERTAYVAGPPTTRAGSLSDAFRDPTIAALIAVRGGYGSVQILPLLDADEIRRHPKPFIGYSDNTSLLTWLTQACGMVAFHGPMIEGRFARGSAGYDRDSFERCLCTPEPPGAITHPNLETLREGDATGVLVGGTLTNLVASLGTPYAFDPPPGCILFLDEVAERPYRIDRMLTQLRLSGLLGRAASVIFGELPRCDEPGGSLGIRTVIGDVMADFRGPVLYGLPSGHTSGATLTLPFGVAARVITRGQPAVVIEESAVV
jgi:muramoyltetrapeptide carboxypeptidase